jgi:tryptophan synthase beta chain
VFEAALRFTRAEGMLAEPEAGHAVRAAIDVALAAKESGAEKVILFNYSGHGLLDLSAYDDFMAGKLTDGEG